ncbi:MAG: hypothetical protein IAI50_19010 [Candidatus Eremiobacteraeota bacterium]|nr:hypothetical protein [Candidatus Eremiobacteraeota bacterium]
MAPAACSGALPAAYVDEVVYHFVDRYFSYPGFEKGLRVAVEMHNEALKTPRVIPETALLEARVATLRRDIQNLLAQVERTGSAALTDRLVQRENELRETQERRTVLEASGKAAVPVDADDVVTVAQGLRRARRSRETVAFKECLRGLLDRVEVDFTKRANRDLTFSFKREDPLPSGYDASFPLSSTGLTITTTAPLCFVARIDLRNPRTEDGDKLRRVGRIARAT